MPHRPIYKRLYFQVLFAIALGVCLGTFYPDAGTAMKPLGDAFIKLIKMMIAPIIFATVVVGIAKMGDMREVGRVGLKALVYFETVTTVALAIGLVVVNVLKPGAGMNVDPHTLDTKGIAHYTEAAAHQSTVDFFMNIIPNSVVDAFAKGEIIQVLLFSVLFGLALSHLGEKTKPLVKILDEFCHGLFGVINMIMHFAPLGAFGAMAFTIGKYGLGSLSHLGFLMLNVYITCILFVFVVLGLIAHFTGFSLWKFLVYVKEEILIVLGTSSSESALPRMMTKLENLGCSKPVVGMVIPTGYSFNLDGTSIYLTMAAIFIAQATNVDLSLGEELTILGVLLLTSKGAAAVTGGGFITLAATLSTMGGKLPVEGLALLLGVDRFMSEARAITNLIGNGVATIVVSKWENALDKKRLGQVLNGESEDQADEPEDVSDGELVPADIPDMKSR
ncbi:dicarboxylate/amino acid:cation symporter [Azospira inquinata]|uniref:C4-dicarboxylate transport protein n=1 Tax=Azospira inquinata TaxID=2785627 RepID=A0A975XUF0_9RHOO|nr:dicarboxylate/amino acid:cation symporter [Azospira inquinata]QWT45964.1 dicarboxylate/amino acid:cation symporter [Azospira inquinata]QWT48709.1 dicarboxylate/amino acid:cation symporter [Azospira inquinata]